MVRVGQVLEFFNYYTSGIQTNATRRASSCTSYLNPLQTILWPSQRSRFFESCSLAVAKACASGLSAPSASDSNSCRDTL